MPEHQMAQCPALPVLLYHRVGQKCRSSNSTPELFLSHMHHLAENGYRTLSGEEFEACALGKMATPQKAVLITLDDGYANNYLNAYPILKSLGMRAVIFAITGKIGHEKARRSAVATGSDAEEYLRWSEISDMVSSGVFEAHSHSHTHVRWDLVPDLGERMRVLEEDLAISRQLLKDQLGGSESCHLAWPWGLSVEDTRALAKRLGFKFQYTVKHNFNKRGTSLDQINRLCMDGQSLRAFTARLGFYRNPVLKHVYPPLLRQYDLIKRLVKKA